MQMTLRYAHLSPGAIRSAVDALVHGDGARMERALVDGTPAQRR